MGGEMELQLELESEAKDMQFYRPDWKNCS